MKQINHTLQQKLAEFKAKSGMNQTQLARGAFAGAERASRRKKALNAQNVEQRCHISGSSDNLRSVDT